MKTVKIFCIWFIASQACFASSTQSLNDINEAVHNFVLSSLAADGQYEISETQIDPRLQLPACDQSLAIFSQSGSIEPGRNTIGVRCNGTNNWLIYSTVSVKSFKDVIVLAKQLGRNDLIGIEHLRSESRDVATLQQGYLTNPEDIVNKQATRAIAAGTVLNRLHYTEPTLVKRGEQVSIQSGKPGFLISATGIAMMDGSKGQQISVKNISSKRVIQATVAGHGLVTVYF
ncbi:flagellar basal body P-ring formation chaperone FlgA [Methylomonas sp. MgM2]